MKPFRAYQAEVQDTVEAYEAREENFLLGIVGAVIGVIIGGAVALLVARLGYVSVLARGCPRLLYYQRL